MAAAATGGWTLASSLKGYPDESELPQVFQGARLSGTYDLPWNIAVASTFTAQSGEYYPRDVQVRDALNQLLALRVEGQAARYDWVRLVDVRVSNVVTLGKHSFEGMFDVFNLANTSVVLRHVNAH